MAFRRTLCGSFLCKEITNINLLKQRHSQKVCLVPLWKQSTRLCSSGVGEKELKCELQNGLPTILVPLPSKQETCQFTLKPVTETVGDFLNNVKSEDGGVERVSLYSEDDIIIARSTSIDVLMRKPFKLRINDNRYIVHPPDLGQLSSEDLQAFSDVKSMIYQLYSTLHVEEHQLQREKDLRKKMEKIQSELQPLEELKQELDQKAASRTNFLVWGGLGYMGFQFGLLARLTWWEYSWDIVEPITYFVTYGTALAMYAYYVLTRQEYLFPDARDRQYLLFFHKYAKRKQMDVEKYNKLKYQMAQVELDLERLHDPLSLNLPIRPPKQVKE
ncbi:Calcium uniporter protein, mitochondrial [Holothuria leucospilota]|uniref:Calcium uniporter protein n=1 Tax=Holothuria leucospilota TaxID=206669 RepID=A0A9Q1BF76_HOLLE|nr:Calcium uniporter protein, mitochondrial [Holothuria leucospilota]